MSGLSVYFARCTTFDGVDMHAIKIGCSLTVSRRLKAVAMLQPYDCQLLATFDGGLFHEGLMHLWLHKHRIGGEFFRDDPEVIEVIDHVNRTGHAPFQFREGPFRWITMDDFRAFIEAYEITAADIAAVTGRKAKTYEIHIKTQEKASHRLVGAAMVVAMRRGHSITYPNSFQQLKAAA